MLNSEYVTRLVIGPRHPLTIFFYRPRKGMQWELGEVLSHLRNILGHTVSY